MNKAGLLGYAGNWNNDGIIALQVETASCIENITEIAAVPGVDILFLGQNDLCMSMGLYNKYEFPHMYTSPELNAATQKLVEHARKNSVILGIFLFGTSRVGEFLEKGFTFISVGNDLHHVLTRRPAPTSTTWKTSRKRREKAGREDRPRCSRAVAPIVWGRGSAPSKPSAVRQLPVAISRNQRGRSLYARETQYRFRANHR